VEHLTDRVPASKIGVSVRDPEKASDLQGLGIRVRQGDYEDAERLRHAFEGAQQVLLISSPARRTGGDPLLQHRTAIESAQWVGAERIVYTSHMAASDTSAFPPMLDHAQTEQMLKGSGIAWTALRNGFYSSSGLELMGDAFTKGFYSGALDGKFSWTAHDDLAEIAAIILAGETKFDGPTPALTGSQALNLADLCAIASEQQEQRVVRKIIPDEQFRTSLTSKGMPPGAVEMIVGLFIAARNGEFAKIDPTLENLLGRKPITMKELIAKHLKSRNS